MECQLLCINTDRAEEGSWNSWHLRCSYRLCTGCKKMYGISKAALHSPYCHQPAATAAAGAIQCIDIGDTKAGGYDYTDATLNQTAWYTSVAKSTQPKASYSGVYFDQGGGNIYMDTFSVPVTGPDGKLVAVATADIRAAAPADRAAASGTEPRPAGLQLLLLLHHPEQHQLLRVVRRPGWL